MEYGLKKPRYGKIKAGCGIRKRDKKNGIRKTG